MLHSLDDSVAPGVELGILGLCLWVSEDIVDSSTYTHVDWGCSAEARDSTLQLATVEDYGAGLVTQQVAFEIPYLG